MTNTIMRHLFSRRSEYIGRNIKKSTQNKPLEKSMGLAESYCNVAIKF